MSLPNANGSKGFRQPERRQSPQRREPESSNASCQQRQEPQRPSTRLTKAKEQPQQPNPTMALAAAQHAENQNPGLPPPTQNWQLPPAPCLYPASSAASPNGFPLRPDSASSGPSPKPC